MSVYTKVVERAEMAKAAHEARMSARVRAHAARHPERFLNDSGEIDPARVERRARADWWKRSRFWIQGLSPDVVERPVERAVIAGLLATQRAEEARRHCARQRTQRRRVWKRLTREKTCSVV